MSIIEQLSIELKDADKSGVERVKVHEGVKAVDFYEGYVIVTRDDDETFTIDSENVVTIKK